MTTTKMKRPPKMNLTQKRKILKNKDDPQNEEVKLPFTMLSPTTVVENVAMPFFSTVNFLLNILRWEARLRGT